jgi:hypothetical protein
VTTLTLAQVVDLDCIASFAPLVLDVPATERYAMGGDAIVRRVLYAWVLDGGLLELPGRTLSAGDLVIIRSKLAALAENEDYVKAVTMDLELDPSTSTLSVVAGEILIDGQVYPLEVATGDASAAILALGSASG